MTSDYWGDPYDGMRHPDKPDPRYDFNPEADPIEDKPTLAEALADEGLRDWPPRINGGGL